MPGQDGSRATATADRKRLPESGPLRGSGIDDNMPGLPCPALKATRALACPKIFPARPRKLSRSFTA